VPVNSQATLPPIPPKKPGPNPEGPPVLPNGARPEPPALPTEKGGKGLLNSVKNRIGGRNSGEDPTSSGLRSGLERLMSSGNRPSGSGNAGSAPPTVPRVNTPYGRDADAQPTPESDISKSSGPVPRFEADRYLSQTRMCSRP
jgi:hypothetical protein